MTDENLEGLIRRRRTQAKVNEERIKEENVEEEKKREETRQKAENSLEEEKENNLRLWTSKIADENTVLCQIKKSINLSEIIQKSSKIDTSGLNSTIISTNSDTAHLINAMSEYFNNNKQQAQKEFSKIQSQDMKDSDLVITSLNSSDLISIKPEIINNHTGKIFIWNKYLGNPKYVMSTNNFISEFIIHNKELYDSGKKGVFKTNSRYALTTMPIDKMVVFNGEIYGVTSDNGRLEENIAGYIHNISSGKTLPNRKKVRDIIVHQGKLYDASSEGFFETLVNKKILPINANHLGSNGKELLVSTAANLFSKKTDHDCKFQSYYNQIGFDIDLCSDIYRSDGVLIGHRPSSPSDIVNWNGRFYDNGGGIVLSGLERETYSPSSSTLTETITGNPISRNDRFFRQENHICAGRDGIYTNDGFYNPLTGKFEDMETMKDPLKSIAQTYHGGFDTIECFQLNEIFDG